MRQHNKISTHSPLPVIIMNDPFRLFLKIRITVMAMVATRTTTTTRHDHNDNNKYGNNLLTCIVNVENQNVVHVQSSFYNKTTVLWDTQIVFLKLFTNKIKIIASNSVNTYEKRKLRLIYRFSALMKGYKNLSSWRHIKSSLFFIA